MGFSAVAPGFYGSIVGPLDVWKPEEYTTIFKRYNKQGGEYFRWIVAAGFEMACAQPDYHWAEEDIKAPTFGAANSPAASAVSQSIVLDAGSVDSLFNFYPGLNDRILYPDQTTGLITTIAGSGTATVTLTVVPVDGSTLPAVVAGTTIFSIYTNSWTESSGQPRGRITKVTRFENDLQQIKASLEVSGWEMTNQTWYTINNLPNAPLYTTGLEDMQYRMDLATEGALLFGVQTSASIIDPLTLNPQVSTQGLVPSIRDRGIVFPYTPGTLTTANFYTWGRLLDAQFGGNSMAMFNGANLANEIENLLVNSFKDTNIILAAKQMFNGNEKLAANLSFKSLIQGGRTWSFTSMGSFNNPQTYAAAGHDGPNMGIIVPMGEKKDTESGKLLPQIGMRYKAYGAYSRKMETYNVNGAGDGLKVSEYDINKTFMRRHIGGHQMGVNQMMLLESA